jgi:uncharacterized membrane protein
MKKLGILSILLLVLTSIVLAVPAFNIPDVNMNEDTTSTINLDSYATSVTWTWTNSAHVTVTKNSANVATLTPQANWNGVETVKFKATSTTDASDFYEDNVIVTVNSVNDAPTYSPSIPSPQVWDAGTSKTLNLATYFHDADGDTLTYTWTPSTLDDIDVSISGSTVTLTPRDSDFIGENTVQFTASDGIASVSSGNITLRIEPNICDSGKVGKLSLEIKNPDNGDEFKPGDTIDIEVKVDNDYSKDLDIGVTAILYDLTDGSKVDDVDSKVINIDNGDDDTFEMTLEVPSDVTDGDDYRLYIKAYEDNAEEDHCDYDYVNLDITKEKHDMIINDFTANPSTVSCGNELSFTLKTENIGRSDEEDVYYKLQNSELKLNIQTDSFDVDEGDDYVLRNVLFTIPKDAAEKTYTILAEVFYNDGSDSNSKSLQLTVSGCKVIAPGQEIILSALESSFDLNAGDTKQVLMQIKNNEDELASYVVSLSASGFGKGSEQAVVLEAGETKVVTLTLVVNSDATTGSKSAIITVEKDGNTIKTATVNANVKGKEVKQSTISNLQGAIGSNIFWIIGDIVLVIVAIFFIKLIFTSGRSKMKEMK